MAAPVLLLTVEENAQKSKKREEGRGNGILVYPAAGETVAILATICGIALILVVLWEGFETIILPRRVTRRFRLTRLFYRSTWLPWGHMVNRIIPAQRQETWLSVFGPLSLLLLLSIWACGLITGFAVLHWAVGATIVPHAHDSGLLTDLYMSSTTFFTLGLGDALPANGIGRLLVVIESGMGFGFLALIIAYLPALNQSFSRREVTISLLDARAGSPPTAAEMLIRHGHEHGMEALKQLFHEWEQWSADFLEGHLSYPVLAYFRSQHDNQSWLGALTAILDGCSLVMVGVEGACERQAELTFAMARHALVDLSLVFQTKPLERHGDRLPAEKFHELRGRLDAAGVKLRGGEAEEKLIGLREMYEPYLLALAAYFRLKTPPWIPEQAQSDNWEVSSWERRAVSRRTMSGIGKGDHF